MANDNNKNENSNNDEIFIYKIGMTKDDVPKNVERVKVDSDVKRIEDGAFGGRDDLYEVDFSEATSLEEIGQQAFDSCNSLLEVDIPFSVNKIERHAFFECEKLTKVKVREGSQIEAFGELAFAFCSALEEVDINSPVDKNVNGAFFGCKKLTIEDHEPFFVYKSGMIRADVPEHVKRVKVDADVKRIEDQAFKEQRYLYEVDFSEATSLEEIGEAAFYYCFLLLEVDIPSSVYKIESEAFGTCAKLERVKGMSGVKEMGKSVFKGCKAWEEVEIMSPFLSEIPEGTFAYCEKLTKVKMVEGLKVIGKKAFYECKSLSEVEFPLSLERIEEKAFYDCSSLLELELHSSLEAIGDRAFYHCIQVTRVKVREGSQLKAFGMLAFASCQALVDLDIPSSINKNVNGAFAGCKKLTIEDHEPVFVYKSGMTKKDVPSGVKRVKIDSDVKRIENGAFREDLYEVDFSEATSLEEIGEGAFYYCTSLLEVDIPSSVNKIELGAFSQCEKLERVKGMSGVKEMGYDVFDRCNALVEVELSPFLSEIPQGTFSECSNLTKVNLAEGLKVIGLRAFDGCRSLLEVEFPVSLERIEDSAFSYCENLAKVKMMEGLKFIGIDAFDLCEVLSEVDVPGSVTFVGTNAFKDTKRVESSLGNNVALGIRLRATHPSQTEETIPLKKLVNMYSLKPIDSEKLHDRNNKAEIDLLGKIVSLYIKYITTLNATTASNRLLSFQEQNGWVQLVTNYDEYVTNEEDSKILIEFLSSKANKDTVKALARAEDRNGRVALTSAVPLIRNVFNSRLLFLGRYDISPGAPIHKSATCIVVEAIDTKMNEYYEEIFKLYQDKGFLDEESFALTLKYLHVVSDDYSEPVRKITNEYFDRVDLDRSRKISEEEFVLFCLGHFGSKVVLKFMKNKDQFQRELSGRKTSTKDKVSDTMKDNALSKYVVTVIRSHDEADNKMDIESLKETVGPYLSKREISRANDAGVQPAAKNQEEDRDNPEAYCHVLVMPYGDRNLDTIFRSERPDTTKARDLLTDVGQALVHLHDRGLIHGDLKMLNVVRVLGRLALIDLDASAVVGRIACAKFSSGVLPPELIHAVEDVSEAKQLEEYYKVVDKEEQAKRAPKYSRGSKRGYVVKSFLTNENEVPKTEGLPYVSELVKAHPSLDVWSFGVLLYAMCTGEQSLFPVSRDDDLVDGAGLEQLYYWSSDTLLEKLKHKAIDPLAKDLLFKILQKNPTSRPSMKQVLDHAFFKPENQRDLRLEELQKDTKAMLAAQKETQMLVKQGFENLQESMQRMMQKQLAMQNMLKDLGVDKFPKYMVILPKKVEKKWWEKANLKTWMYQETMARICFLCPISLQPVIGPDEEAIGYDIKLPEKWVKEYGPAILIGLKMLQVGFAVGRGFGLPFPSLGDATNKIAETLGEAADLMSNMQDIAMEQLGVEEDDDLASLLVDKVSETIEDATSSEIEISANGRKKIQECYAGVGELVGDKEFKRCGLVEARCDDDGTTEFVHPDLKALYEAKGRKCLQEIRPEEIDKAAAASRAGARNGSQKDVANLSNAGDRVLDEQISETSKLMNETQQSSGFQKNVANRSSPGAGAGELDYQIFKLSNLSIEMQQSLKTLGRLQRPDGASSGGIVSEGFFRIQSRSFPRRWQERQIFLYEDGSVKHFPVSGQWLAPSNGDWFARKAWNGGSIEIVLDGNVCTTLRLSDLIKYSSKTPKQYIDDWVGMLNSQQNRLPTDASTDQQSKATTKSIDFAGEVTARA